MLTAVSAIKYFTILFIVIIFFCIMFLQDQFFSLKLSVNEVV